MIALLPLDNRPCNLRFPQQIGAIGNTAVVLPTEGALGMFNTPGSPKALIEWLEKLPDVGALIVSIDMLAYGGLVASRKPVVPVDEALARLEALRAFRERRPGTPILAFNVLMRLAVTMDSDAAVANYYNVMRYARLADEAERFQSDYLRAELAKVTAEIPPNVLEEYLAARARNHAVNMRMVEWLAEGVFDFLLITQEDASEYGLHRREQEALLQRCGELGVAEKMSLHPGADEAGLTLLARHWNTGVRIRTHWSNLEDATRIAPFEDRPYRESLAQHLAAIRAVPVVGAATVDFELFVNAPVGGSQKDEGDGPRAARRAKLAPFLRAIEGALVENSRIALCDVAFPNGADNLLMTELESRRLLGKISVFGGWNTAGNTTGSVLAQCAALTRGGTVSPDLNRNFLFERYVDDWLYQTRLRPTIEKAARDQELSPFNMGDGYGKIEALAKRELVGLAGLLAKRHFDAWIEECAITLPWHRTFEVDVRARLRVGAG